MINLEKDNIKLILETFTINELRIIFGSEQYNSIIGFEDLSTKTKEELVLLVFDNYDDNIDLISKSMLEFEIKILDDTIEDTKFDLINKIMLGLYKVDMFKSFILENQDTDYDLVAYNYVIDFFLAIEDLDDIELFKMLFPDERDNYETYTESVPSLLDFQPDILKRILKDEDSITEFTKLFDLKSLDLLTSDKIIEYFSNFEYQEQLDIIENNFDQVNKDKMYNYINSIIATNFPETLDYIDLNEVVVFLNNLSLLQLQSLLNYNNNLNTFNSLDVIIKDYIENLDEDSLNDFHSVLNNLFYTNPDLLEPTPAENLLSEIYDKDNIILNELDLEGVAEYINKTGTTADLSKILEVQNTDFIKKLLLYVPIDDKLKIYDAMQERFNYVNNEIQVKPRYGSNFVIGFNDRLFYDYNYDLKHNIKITEIYATLSLDGAILAETNINTIYVGKDVQHDNGYITFDYNTQIDTIYNIKIIFKDSDSTVYEYDDTIKTVSSEYQKAALLNPKELFSDKHDRSIDKLFHIFKPKFMLTDSIEKVKFTIIKLLDTPEEFVLTYRRDNEFNKIENNYFTPEFKVVYDLVGMDTTATNSNTIYPETQVLIQTYDSNNKMVTSVTNNYKKTIDIYNPKQYSNKYGNTSEFSFNEQYYKMSPIDNPAMVYVNNNLDSIDTLFNSTASTILEMIPKTVCGGLDLTNPTTLLSDYGIALYIDFKLLIMPKCKDRIGIYLINIDEESEEYGEKTLVEHIDLSSKITVDFGVNEVYYTYKMLLDDTYQDKTLKFMVQLESPAYDSIADNIVQTRCFIYEYQDVQSFNISFAAGEKELKLFELLPESKFNDYVGVTKYKFMTNYNKQYTNLLLDITTNTKGNIPSYKVITSIYDNQNRGYGDKIFESINNNITSGSTTFSVGTGFILENQKKYYITLTTYFPHDSGVPCNTTMFEIDPIEFTVGGDQNIANDIDHTRGQIMEYKELDELYAENNLLINKMTSSQSIDQINDDYIDEKTYNLVLNKRAYAQILEGPQLVIKTNKTQPYDGVREFNIGLVDNDDKVISIPYKPFTESEKLNNYNIIYRDNIIEDTVDSSSMFSQIESNGTIYSKAAIEYSMENDGVAYFNELIVFNNTVKNLRITTSFIFSNNEIDSEQTGTFDIIVEPGVTRYSLKEIEELNYPFDSYIFQTFEVMNLNAFDIDSIDEALLPFKKYHNFIGNGKDRRKETGTIFYKDPSTYIPLNLLELSGVVELTGKYYYNMIINNNMGELLTIKAKIAFNADDDIGLEVTNEVTLELSELNQNLFKINKLSTYYRNKVNSIAIYIISVIGQSGKDYTHYFEDDDKILATKTTDDAISLSNINIFEGGI